MENGELTALLAREKELAGTFVGMTNEQHRILTEPEVDEQALNKSLAGRRRVLEELEKISGRLSSFAHAAPERVGVFEELERAVLLDRQNLELCERFMAGVGEQAKHMTKSRKVVVGYGKSAGGALSTSEFFDKRQ